MCFAVVNENKFYTARLDKAFKCIFLEDKDTTLIEDLLEFCLKVKISNIEILYNEQSKNNVHSKGNRLDCLLDTNKGRICIEMNGDLLDYTHKKNCDYMFTDFSHYYKVNQNYEEEVKFIQVNFTYGKKDKRLYRKFTLQDSEGQEFIDNFEIYEFYMANYEKMWENRDEKAINENYRLVMLNRNLEELAEMKKINKGVDKYMARLEEVNKDKKFIETISDEEMHQRLMKTERSLGEKNGERKKAIETAKNMLEDGINIEKIVKYTGLSMTEIEKIKLK